MPVLSNGPSDRLSADLEALDRYSGGVVSLIVFPVADAGPDGLSRAMSSVRRRGINVSAYSGRPLLVVRGKPHFVREVVRASNVLPLIERFEIEGFAVAV